MLVVFHTTSRYWTTCLHMVKPFRSHPHATLLRGPVELAVSHSPAIRPWRVWRASLSCASRCAKDAATARRSPQVSLLAPSDSLRHEDVPRQSRWPTVTKRPDASTRFSMTFRRATIELYMYMSRILHDMSYVVVEVGWDWTWG